MNPEKTSEAEQIGEWMRQAQCKIEGAQMFPKTSLGVGAAQNVCARCVVREPCLEFALEHRVEHGVWGGASERERRRIIRRRQENSQTS